MSQNIIGSLKPENKFSYTDEADLQCSFDPLFDASLPPETRYHFWLCILSAWIVFLYPVVNDSTWQIGCYIA